MDAMLEKLISVVTASAPLLGSVLGSPMAGIAISLLSSHFGVFPDVANILSKITSVGDVANTLKQLEDQNKLALQQLNLQAYQTEVSDRQNARETEVQLSQGGNKDFVPHLIAISFLITYVMVQGYVVLYPSAGADLISARVQDIFLMIAAYYFGSSHRGILPPS